MIRTQRRLRLSMALIAVNLVFIWGNSLIPGEISGQISDFVKKLLAQLVHMEETEDSTGGFLVRKLAHFTEFAALGGLLAWRFGMLGKKRRWPLVWGCAAACMDEILQCFVPDRGPSVKDVLLDSSGVAFGMAALLLGHTYLRNRKQLGGNKP